MRKMSATVIVASLLALFHFFAVVVPVVSSGANGEGQGMAVAFFDFPLGVLLYYLPDTNSIFTNMTEYTLVFCIGGTLMYAGAGALIGWVIDSIRHRHQPA